VTRIRLFATISDVWGWRADSKQDPLRVGSWVLSSSDKLDEFTANYLIPDHRWTTLVKNWYKLPQFPLSPKSYTLPLAFVALTALVVNSFKFTRPHTNTIWVMNVAPTWEIAYGTKLWLLFMIVSPPIGCATAESPRVDMHCWGRVKQRSKTEKRITLRMCKLK
jgi:hypothetical protein